APPPEPLIERFVASLDEPIGAQDHGRSRGQRLRELAKADAHSGSQRSSGLHLQDPDGPVRVTNDRRKVGGAGKTKRGMCRVEDSIDDGCHLIAAEELEELIKSADD